jgi:hypothetical protein
VTGPRRAIVNVLLGAWLAIVGASAAGAIASFDAAAHAEARGSDRVLARAQAADANASLFRTTGRAQLVLGGLCLACASWPPRLSRGLAALVAPAALIALAIAASLGPRIVQAAQAHDVERLRALHSAAGVATLAQLVLLAAAVALSVTLSRPEGAGPAMLSGP